MTDYMKEAERLMRQYTTAVLEKNSEAIAFYHFALLAHIQRGAVPEGGQVVPMPEPDYRGPAEAGTYFNGYAHTTMRTYGDAREAAGYARGLADGQGHCRRLTETDKAQAAAALRGEVKP